MAVWSSRKKGYKLGVGFMLLALVIYVTGFASPFWTEYNDGTGRIYAGLWMVCQEIEYHMECANIPGTVDSYTNAERAMETLGLIGLALAGMYAVYVNARSVATSRTRVLEILSAFGGLCGFIGCMIVVGEYHAVQHRLFLNLSWAFGLSLAGSIVSMCTAVIIYVTNRADVADAGAASTATVACSGTAGVTTIMQPPRQEVCPPPPKMVYVPQMRVPQGFPAPPYQYPWGNAPPTPSAPFPAGQGGNKA